MPWTLLVTLVPEVVRGVFSIVRENIARKKAEADARKAEADAKKAKDAKDDQHDTNGRGK